MGRTPKPEHLKILHGTARKDRRKGPQPPGIEPGVPEMPDWLDGFGREMWARVVETLTPMRILTVADGDALTLLCATYSQWRRACAVLAKEGCSITTENANGEVIKKRAEVDIEADSAKRLRALLSDFGLSPASHGKVAPVHNSQSEPSELQKFLNRGKRSHQPKNKGD